MDLTAKVYKQIFFLLDSIIKIFPNEVTTWGDKKHNQQRINEIQKALGVSLPKDYVYFLINYGELDLWGIEIYGTNMNPKHTERLRKLGSDPDYFPRYLVGIYEEGDGTSICIDTSRDNKIVCWGNEFNWVDEETGKCIFEPGIYNENFTEFLFDQICFQVECVLEEGVEIPHHILAEIDQIKASIDSMDN